ERRPPTRQTGAGRARDSLPTDPSPLRHLLIRTRQRVPRTRPPERTVALESLQRFAHRKDFIAGMSRLHLRLDEREQRTEVVAESGEVRATAGDREAGVRVTEDVDSVR